MRHDPADAAGPAGANRPARAGDPAQGGRQPWHGAAAEEPRTGTAERGGARRGPDPGPTADERDAERGLRGLIGSGASQVSVAAAMRARDAARPTEADLAEAAQRLVLVRRNWVPRDELPGTGRAAAG